MSDLLTDLEQFGVVPVALPRSINDACILSEALTKAGLNALEITLRKETAVSAIKVVAEEFPDVILGAGTVLTRSQAEQALDAGAKFLVSPGIDPDLVEWAVDNSVVHVPGVATASEATLAFSLGVTTVKFFPAEAMGGVQGISALAAPFPMLRFIPTGGVTRSNLLEYLLHPAVRFCGGSWLADIGSPKGGDFDTVHGLAKEALRIASGARHEIDERRDRPKKR